ncbi:MAG: hypothetical protein U1B83_04880, partial [Candidatus Cloacimonadaceae bacterium]|nr:hypothetical protein [Candidatus Cloacimonadaceae bacterium]
DLDIEAKAFLWNTRAVLLSKYPVNLPFIVVETDGNDLDATISRGSVGSSVLGGQISLTNLQKGLLFKPSQLDLSVDLAMIDPNLKGIVSANVSASGSIEDPTVKVRASSPVIAYDIWQIQGIRLDAELKDDIVEYTLSGASWENQSLDSAGSFDLNTYMLTASLETHPLVIDPEGLMINAAADIELSIYDIYPEIKVNFTQLDVESGSMAAKGFSGNIHLIPATHDNGTRNYYVNCDLTGKDGHHISVVGDILDRNLLLEANFGTIALADFIPADAVQALNPKISGSLNAFMLKDKIIGKAELNLSLEGDVNYHSDLSAIGSYDISSNDATLYLEGNDGILNGESLEFELVSSLNKGILNLASLRINDQINLSGSVDLNDTSEYAFNMTLKNFDLKLIESFYPPIGDGLPDIKGINITAIYNLDGDRHIALAASADSILIDGIVPMSAEFMLKGPPGEILISGFVSNMRRELISLKGEVNLNGRLDIDMTATMNSVFVSDVVQMAPVEGAISASVNVNAVGLLSDEPDMVFTAKVTSPKIIIPEVVDLEDIHIEVRQTAEILYVDSLYVRSDQLAMIQGSGALDYNVLSGTIFDGSNHLSIRAEAELFHWLTKNVDM